MPAEAYIIPMFDQDLNTITNTLAALGARVEAMLQDSIQAITRGDRQLAQSVIEGDIKADAMYAQINRDVLSIIAKHHPQDIDLRRIIGAVKIAGDLERVGDLAHSIAVRSGSLETADSLTMTRGIARIGRQATNLLSRAIDAMLQQDSRDAIQVWLGDDDIDEHYNSLFRELLTFMMEDPRKISASTHLLFVAKNLERVGDHASNIAETAYYIVEGRALVKDRTLTG